MFALLRTWSRQDWAVDVAHKSVLAAVPDYIPTAELVAFTHTEVQPGFEGRGVAGELVRQALQDVRDQHLLVLAVCPSYTAVLARHPEQYDDLVSVPHRDGRRGLTPPARPRR